MRKLMMPLVIVAGLFSASAYAEDHLHDGDIEVEIEGGKLGTHGAGHTQVGSGYAIFESDFRDLAKGPYATNAPGFDSHNGVFEQNDIVGYQAIGSLWAWNGSSWTSSLLNGETIKLGGNLGETTTWGATGVTGDVIGTLGQAGSAGNIHEHLTFTIAGASGLPSNGAYYITLQLISADLNSSFDGIVANGKYASSDPFYLVFNNGLSASEFHASVHGLSDIAPVPEPSSYAMLMLGLGLIGWRLRKRT
ncbi:PEP-CTERM sorting domain-containing protein [Methylobacillus gramineus]|uniref:PEP-CTERM sorting domain-containing protein n=1 Tax=Methylobacillus gramineus TaxID=755169 RepID=UPI001CFFA3DF|nr:PEP-CTERM sorting domain-containing protein [Methylobacillus gramineus]MCB5185145.1 PEP-CTERM sorting domain-containing protein [Methylobacillus gramineus]